MKTKYRILLLFIFYPLFYQTLNASLGYDEEEEGIELQTPGQALYSAKRNTNDFIKEILNPLSLRGTFFRFIAPLPFDWVLSIIKLPCASGQSTLASNATSLTGAFIVSESCELISHLLKRKQIKIDLNLLPHILDSENSISVPRIDFLNSADKLISLKIKCTSIFLWASLIPLFITESDLCPNTHQYSPLKFTPMVCAWILTAIWNLLQEYGINKAYENSPNSLLLYKNVVFGPPIPPSPSLWSRIKGYFNQQGDRQPLLG
jgi:hypothetical protein